MIRTYHNHKLQTNPCNREEESHNNHETPGRRTKQSNQLSIPHRDDCKAKKWTLSNAGTITDSHNGRNNQQRLCSNRIAALAKATGGGGGVNVFYWYQTFALHSAVVEAQICSARREDA